VTVPVPVFSRIFLRLRRVSDIIYRKCNYILGNEAGAILSEPTMLENSSMLEDSSIIDSSAMEDSSMMDSSMLDSSINNSTVNAGDHGDVSKT
jgi:hypothetical protein